MRLRFTIRDLLWLMGIIALLIGWYVDHMRLSARNTSLLGVQINPASGMRPDITTPDSHIEFDRYDYRARGVTSVVLNAFAVKDQKVLELGSAHATDFDAHSAEIVGALYLATLLPAGNAGPKQVVDCGITADGACRKVPLAEFVVDSSYRLVSSVDRHRAMSVPPGKEEVVWGYCWQPKTAAAPITVNELLAQPDPFQTLDKDKIIEFAKNSKDSIVLFVTVVGK